MISVLIKVYRAFIAVQFERRLWSRQIRHRNVGLRPIRDFAGSLRSKRSSFRDTINHLYQGQAHSYVDDSRYLCSSQ